MKHLNNSIFPALIAEYPDNDEIELGYDIYLGQEVTVNLITGVRGNELYARIELFNGHDTVKNEYMSSEEPVLIAVGLEAVNEVLRCLD